MIPQCKKIAYCKACISSDYTIQASDTMEILPLDIMKVQKGNLTLTSDGGIKIGKGISTISISCNVYWYNPLTLNVDKIIYIYKNSTQQGVTNHYITNAYEHFNVSTICEVSEGDVIYLKARGTLADVIKNYNNGTFMCIQQID